MTAGGGVSAFPGAAILLLIRTVRSGRGGARTEPEPGVPAPRPPGGRESPSRVHYLCLKSQEDFLWVSDLEPWWSFSAERPGAPPDPPPETRSAAGTPGNEPTQAVVQPLGTGCRQQLLASLGGRQGCNLALPGPLLEVEDCGENRCPAHTGEFIGGLGGDAI
ncbi:uncharacterized protein [Lepidochelys kempii]|uniref:uncharacterized protein isoform X3 n=1 Tax=Lepidochelys kempii TaxID=8472 RepID=UPI003C6F2948